MCMPSRCMLQMKGAKRGGMRTFTLIEKIVAFDKCHRDEQEGPPSTILGQVLQIARDNEQTARREEEERMAAEAENAANQAVADQKEFAAAKKAAAADAIAKKPATAADKDDVGCNRVLIDVLVYVMGRV